MDKNRDKDKKRDKDKNKENNNKSVYAFNNESVEHEGTNVKWNSECFLPKKACDLWNRDLKNCIVRTYFRPETSY